MPTRSASYSSAREYIGIISTVPTAKSARMPVARSSSSFAEATTAATSARAAAVIILLRRSVECRQFTCAISWAITAASSSSSFTSPFFGSYRPSNTIICPPGRAAAFTICVCTSVTSYGSCGMSDTAVMRWTMLLSWVILAGSLLSFTPCFWSSARFSFIAFWPSSTSFWTV